MRRKRLFALLAGVGLLVFAPVVAASRAWAEAETEAAATDGTGETAPAEPAPASAPEPAPPPEAPSLAPVVEGEAPPEAPAQAPVPPAPPAVPPDVVGEVRFEGNILVETPLLKNKVQTKAGDRLDPSKIRADVKSLFSLGNFEDVVVLEDAGPEGTIVTFRVKENQVVKEVKIEGNDQIEESKIREVITVKTHAILNPNQVRESVRRVKALYDAQGYTDAIVRDKVKPGGKAVSVVFEIQENEEIYITEVRFTGNHFYEASDGLWSWMADTLGIDHKPFLIDQIETRDKAFYSFLTDRGLFKKDMLDDDAARLSAFYFNNGFIDHKIGDPKVEFGEKGVTVTFPIEEGEQYRIGQVEVSGDLVEPAEKLRELATIKEGELFNRDKIRRDIFALTELYADHGYAFVNVEPDTDVHREERIVDVNLKITQGKKAHFRRIAIKGNTTTRDKVIRRELAVAEGDLYSGSKLRLSKQKLEMLGYFEEINFREDRTVSDEEIDLTVQVKETRTGTLSAGAGFSSVDAFLFNLRFTQQNFLGLGQTVIANLDLGSRRQYYTLTFEEPWLFDIPLLLGVSVNRDQRIFTDFTRKSTGGSLTLGYPLFEFVNGLVTYRFERAEISGVSRDASDFLLSQVGSTDTSSLTFTIKRSTVNNRFDPTKGSLNLASFETAGTFLGGDNDFLKFQVRSAWYFPVFWGVVFSPSARFEYGLAVGNDDELPLPERFFPGGLGSVRGYQSRALGPVDPITGDQIGGNKAVIFNAELIFPIVQKFGLKGLVFADAGEAYDEGRPIDLDKLRTSAGFGFRWFSPIGPLRLEIGYPLERRRGDSAQEVQFSIGGPI